MTKNSVEYDIKVDISQMKASLNQMEANMRNVGSTVTSQTSMMQKGFGGLGTAIAGAFSTAVLISFAQKIITARSEFEKYQSVLTTSYGSVILANKALAMLRQTAEETPYQLNEITGAFVLLKNRGLEPGKKDLINIGDVASATGKTFEQLSQAILDANNSERWREFGIEVQTMGDKMSLSFKGTTIEVERSAEGAMKAVTAFGQLEGIAGSMSGQMETLGGKVSNLGDAFNSMLITFGDTNWWGNVISNLTTASKWVDKIFKKEDTDVSWLEYKLMQGINGLSKEELKAALETKLAEVNKMADDIEKEYLERTSKSFLSKLTDRDFNRKWIKENDLLRNSYIDTANIITTKLAEIEGKKDGPDPTLGLLDEQRKKLKDLTDNLGKQSTEKAILQQYAEIEAVKEKIKYYETLYKTQEEKDAEKKARFEAEVKAYEEFWAAVDRRQGIATAPAATKGKIDGSKITYSLIPELSAAELESERIKEKWDEIRDIVSDPETFNAAVSGFRELSNIFRGTNSELSDVLGKLADMGEKYSDFKANGSTKKDAYGMIISGASELIGMTINAAQERKLATDEFYASAIQQQQDYNFLLNEQLRINSEINGNVIFKGYEGRIADSVNALKDASEKYKEAFKEFNNSEAIVGQKNAVNGNNVLKGVGAGAAMGAGVGTVIPVIGTAIGAAAGAIIGGVVGLFATKKKDIMAPLLATYPKLIKANGDFNIELAKTLIVNNKVNSSTKQTLQNLIDWDAAAENAKEQLVGVIQDIAGSLGSDLKNALVSAFEAGTDSAKVMGEEVNKVLENILSNMIFNAAFGPLLDTLQTDMYASFGLGPDGKTPLEGNPYDYYGGKPVIDNNWADDILKFYQTAGPAMDLFNKSLEDANAVGKEYGYDVFGSNASNSQNTMQGTIKGITEDTGNKLEGSFNAVRISLIEQKAIAMQGYNQLVMIENNTRPIGDIYNLLKGGGNSQIVQNRAYGK